MGTEVLRPQDCLIQRIRVAPAVVFHHRRKSYNASGNPTPNNSSSSNTNTNNSQRKTQQPRSDHRRRSPEPAVWKRSSSADDLRSRSRSNNNNQMVVGQVTILRRGESLDSKNKNNNGNERALYDTGKLGPAAEMVPKQIRMSPVAGHGGSMYAGSACSLSPSPRALPLPSFFNKKPAESTVDDCATKDLRRLLRLE